MICALVRYGTGFVAFVPCAPPLADGFKQFHCFQLIWRIGLTSKAQPFPVIAFGVIGCLHADAEHSSNIFNRLVAEAFQQYQRHQCVLGKEVDLFFGQFTVFCMVEGDMPYLVHNGVVYAAEGHIIVVVNVPFPRVKQDGKAVFALFKHKLSF